MKWNDRYRCIYCGAVLDPGETCDCNQQGNEPLMLEHHTAQRKIFYSAILAQKWRKSNGIE